MNWQEIRSHYDPDPDRHAAACGMHNCPREVFEQLFWGHSDDAAIGDIVRAVDWSAVEWQEELFSGVLMRQVAVPRHDQHGLDAMRNEVFVAGLSDEREAVLESWRIHKTWLCPPIVVEGAVLRSSIRYELLVGVARLANLLGLLDRQEVAEVQRHRVWVGSLRR